MEMKNPSINDDDTEYVTLISKLHPSLNNEEKV